MPLAVIEYMSRIVYLVPELSIKSCRHCVFVEDRIGACFHGINVGCNTLNAICVHDLEQHQINLVTEKLTGESS